MKYIPGYRCPKCGDRLKETTLGILCDDMGHWTGTLEQAEIVDPKQFAFEKFMDENRLRFHSGQFTEEDIAFSAFLEGVEYYNNISVHDVEKYYKDENE